jgi:hypothetical protein
MNRSNCRSICKREEQTSAAVRSGTISDEIAEHYRQCPVCSEVLLVAEFLQTNAILAADERTSLPDPARVWQKAQHRATEQAVRRALRPIRFMKLIACVAFLCSPWLRWLLPLGRELSASWSKVFDLNLNFASKPWPFSPSEITFLIGLSGTIVLLALSSWYMLREE